MNPVVEANGGTLGLHIGSEEYGKRYAEIVQHYEAHKDSRNSLFALAAAHGAMTALAAQLIGALEAAEAKSRDPLDLLRKEERVEGLH